MKGTRALKLRALLTSKIALALLLISVTLVAATIYYYYTIKGPVTVTAPDIVFEKDQLLAGSPLDNANDIDIAQNGTMASIKVGLLPNATWVSTYALAFNASSTKTAYIQINLDNSSAVQWTKVYVFNATSAGKYELELLSGCKVNVTKSNSVAPITSVYYGTCPDWLQDESGNDKFTNQTTLPAWSAGWGLENGEQYFLVIETYGIDGLTDSDAANLWIQVITEQGVAG